MKRSIHLWWWSVRLELHALLAEYYLPHNFRKWWHHSERIRYFQTRIINER